MPCITGVYSICDRSSIVIYFASKYTARSKYKLQQNLEVYTKNLLCELIWSEYDKYFGLLILEMLGDPVYLLVC